MKKLILLLAFFASSNIQAQDLRIIYNLNGCPGNPLIGAPAIYMYAGIGTINAGSTFDYTSGGFSGPANQLSPLGNNLWEICVDPYTFVNSVGQTPPISATIYNITMQFRDLNGTIFASVCPPASGFLQINNPTTAPVSLNPTIVTGIKNCYVGVADIGNAGAAIKCYPNPISSSAEFTYYNSASGKILLEVYNILGKKVKTLVNEKQTAGAHSIKWSGNSDSNAKLSNGCYFYTLTFEGKKVATSKLIIAR